MRVFQIMIGIMCLISTFSRVVCDSEYTESDESDEFDEFDQSGESKESIELKTPIACQSPDLKEGVCKHLEDCVELLASLACPFNDVGRNYIKASKNVCEVRQANGICCPNANDHNDTASDLLPATEYCGLVHIKRHFNKIIGGGDSEIGAWPWLALLGHIVNSKIYFLCTGSLITARHVLTAAHCLDDDLYFVRLGEFDLSKNNETNHVDINITVYLEHENFEPYTGLHDLAILRLEKKVEFSELISPICLPMSSDLRRKSYVGSKPFIAGWGNIEENGEPSDILQELQTTVLDNEVCYKAFKSQGRLAQENQFDESVLCGGDIKGGKDTCQGDSGGPLMMPETINDRLHFYLIGVVSHGIGCGRKGLAAAFTNVPYHMEWILKHLNDDFSKSPWKKTHVGVQ